MKSNIFIPKKIRVGFQNRKDCYTQKLAFIIYYDEKGNIRKETSWNSWRDNKIEPEEYDNEPREGFVLNKKTGDYRSDWNHRMAHIRVYDPNGFEFEITVDNLLYILENTSSIIGKGLEGKFVYGWNKNELVLLPVNSPDYKNQMEYTDTIFENKTFAGKDLILGAAYRTKNNDQLIYMGRFDYWHEGYVNNKYGSGYIKEVKNKGKHYFFCEKRTYGTYYNTYRSIPKSIISVVSETPVEDYAELFDGLEKCPKYSPIDNSKDEYLAYDIEEFKDVITKNVIRNGYRFSCFNSDKETIQIYKNWKSNFYNVSHIEYRQYDRHGYFKDYLSNIETIEDLFGKTKPMYKNVYLYNNKLYKREG